MIDLDQVRRLNVQDGDLLVVPESTEKKDMEVLLEALLFMKPRCMVVIVRGPIAKIDETEMNRLGWYRSGAR